MLSAEYIASYHRAINYIAFDYRHGKGDMIGDIQDYPFTALVAEAFEMPRLLIASKVYDIRQGRLQNEAL